MTRRPAPGGRRARPAWAVLAGVMIALSVVVVSLTVSHPGPSAPPLSSPPPVGQAVDPQLVPIVLQSPTPQGSGAFGQAVATFGNYVAIGAPFQTVAGLTQTGDAYVYDMATGSYVQLLDPVTQNLSRFGFSVATDGNFVAVGAPFGTSEGTDFAGNVYLYTVSGTFLATLTSPNASAHLEFGFSLAMDADWLVIGAPNQFSLGTLECGAVYIVNLQTLAMRMVFSPVPEALGSFGYSVGVSGNNVVVGAPGESPGGLVGAGNVYVVSAVSGDVIASYASPVPVAGSGFGTSVALSGSFLVAGAPLVPTVGPTNGTAYEINLVTDAVRLLNSSAATNDGGFGVSVAVDANTVLVGASAENAAGHLSVGNAYLYSARSGALVSSVFDPPGWPGYGGFGGAVAEAGGPIVIGAAQEYSAGVPDAGLVYIFDQVPLTFTSPAGQPYGYTGSSVAVAGGRMVVGAPGEPLGVYPAAGHAYVIPVDPSPSLSVRALASPNPEDGGLFGWSVATTGSLVVVGAMGESPSGLSGAGRAYVFDASSGALLQTLVSPSPASGGMFGASVAISGSLVVVGAPAELDPSVNGGNAYVFNATTGALVQTLTSPAPEADGYFGFSVSISGNEVLVGAPLETVGAATLAGHAYLFGATTGALKGTLTSPNAQLDGEFGLSVSLAGSLAVVGAPGESPRGVSSAGAVYSFSPSSLTLLHTFLSPNLLSGAGFGEAVATNGGVVVVGSPYAPAVGIGSAGLVYLFSESSGLPIDRLNSPMAASSGEFGSSVSAGASRIAVGAPGEPGGAAGPAGGQLTDAGHGYLFCLTDWSQI